MVCYFTIYPFNRLAAHIDNRIDCHLSQTFNFFSPPNLLQDQYALSLSDPEKPREYVQKPYNKTGNCQVPGTRSVDGLPFSICHL